MAEFFRIRLNEAIAEVERELGIRRTFYADRVRHRRMNPIDANSRIGRMEAAARFLNEYRTIKGGDYEGEATTDGALAR